MKSKFSRRRWLQGSTAALVSLPLLDALRSNAADTPLPKRLVLFFNPNGTIQDQFWPTAAASATATDFTLSPILAPLERHKSQLLLLKGIDLSVTAVGPGGPHQKGMGALFTGSELQAGRFADGDGSLAGWANGISVDQAISNHIGQSTLLPSLELGVRAIEAEVRGRISYAGAGDPLPPENDPAQVFARVFSGFNMDPVELARLRTQRMSVLDTVKGQFAELEAQVSADDRVRLDQHLELVRGVERRLDLFAGASGQCTVPAVPPMLNDDDEIDMPAISTLQLDLLAMAMACDVTRVGSVQYSTAVNAIRFPWINSLGQGHTLSHAGPSDADARDQLIRRATWHAGEIAHFMDTLASFPEGGGSMLDNTLIVWGNELSVGNTHAHEDIPYLLAGGGGGFTMGRFLDYGHVPNNRLLVSILNAFGVDTNAFGYTDFATGALTGLV